MYQAAVEAAKKYLLFKPMLPTNEDFLVLGTSRSVGDDNDGLLDPLGQHLTCFAGGMLAIGSKIFGRTQDLETARQVTDGCVWAYESMPTGIMPELFRLAACPDVGGCEWNEERWYTKVATKLAAMIGEGTPAEKGKDFAERKGLKPGFVEVTDARYMLR